MAKNKWEKLSKTGMLIFMIMVVLGFMLPGFLDVGDNGDGNQQIIEPRLCNQDNDCYLTCDDLPVKVLCMQNLCQQNSCNGYAQYPFIESPVIFSLKIKVGNEVVELKDRLNSADLFVKLNDNSSNFKIYSSKLNFGDVLEKLNIDFDGKCMVLGNKNYCKNEGLELNFTVNGESSYAYENYLPKEGDLIRIVYS
jgi:hypothetical protein